VKTREPNRLVIGIVFLVVVLICPSAYGQDATSSHNKWEFLLIPYGWLISLDGDVTVRGIESSADVSFSDIWENLDFLGQVHFEAWKGEWGLFVDPTYLKLSTDAEVGPIKVDIKTEIWLMEFGGLYRLYEEPMSSGEGRLWKFEMLAGGRYNSLKGDVHGTRDWVDPLVGMRFQADLTERLLLSLRGDLGGLGVGSDFTWNVSALIGYEFTSHITFLVGYRILSIDYEEGSGRDLFVYDVTMSGPILGLAFRF